MQLITDAELEEFRQLAEEQMPSSCTVWRPGGLSPATGTAPQTRVWDDIYTEQPFKLDGATGGSAGTRTVRIGEEELQVAVRVGRLPARTTNLRDGDLIEITAGENSGRWVRIIEATGQDRATEVRVPVYEVAAPKELAA